jgi:hypothetical protein
MNFLGRLKFLFTGEVPVKEVIKEVEVVKLVPYDLVHKAIMSVDRANIRYVKAFSEPEYAEHLSHIARCFTSPGFQVEIDSLVDTQVYEIAERSQDMSFDRGTINGIRIVFERFEALNAEHKKRTQPKEKFDEHEIFS